MIESTAFRGNGRAWLLLAYDVGRAIDLKQCSIAIATREIVGPRRLEWPHLFGLNERPLVWFTDDQRILLDGHELTLQCRLILYDFGNVSVAFSCPISLWGHAPLLLTQAATTPLIELASTKLSDILKRIGHAIEDPQPTVGPTRYGVLQIDSVEEPDALLWLNHHRHKLAGVLRDEAQPLSESEVADALGRTIAYGPGDLVVIDSQAALIVDDHWEDILAVLDFANCERLTMQTLDDELDTAIEVAGRLWRTKPSLVRRFFRPGHDLHRLTRLTLDATTEYEAVENAVKLTGDDYLARVYRLAVERFHLMIFQEGIARKIGNLWNLQKVFLEQAANRRSEMLEWVIIILIAVELLQAFR